MTDSRFIVAYVYEHKGKAMIGDVSGNSINCSSEFVFSPDGSNNISLVRLSRLNDSSFLLGYKKNQLGWQGIVQLGTVSGSTISWESGSVFNNSYTNIFSMSALNERCFVFVYQDGFGNQLCKIGKLMPELYPIGVALNSGTGGSTIQVAVSGVASGLNGLSTGTKYYADESGNLTSTETERYIGMAMSETELMIQTDRPGSNTIPDDSVTSAKIVDGAISYTEIASGAIKPDRLAGSDSSSLTNGASGNSLITNGDGSFSWSNIISSPFHAASPGDFAYSFGTYGNETGEFRYPEGIAVDNDGKIYVSEYGNDRVQVFSNSGTFEYSIGSGQE
ncbi:hypothetical protein MHK_004839, partial [Candidatus Magnetomorum sp. HK-1]